MVGVEEAVLEGPESEGEARPELLDPDRRHAVEDVAARGRRGLNQ